MQFTFQYDGTSKTKLHPIQISFYYPHRSVPQPRVWLPHPRIFCHHETNSAPPLLRCQPRRSERCYYYHHYYMAFPCSVFCRGCHPSCLQRRVDGAISQIWRLGFRKNRHRLSVDFRSVQPAQAFCDKGSDTRIPFSLFVVSALDRCQWLWAQCGQHHSRPHGTPAHNPSSQPQFNPWTELRHERPHQLGHKIGGSRERNIWLPKPSTKHVDSLAPVRLDIGQWIN